MHLHTFDEHSVHVYFVFPNFISWDETSENFSIRKLLKIAANTS